VQLARIHRKFHALLLRLYQLSSGLDVLKHGKATALPSQLTSRFLRDLCQENGRISYKQLLCARRGSKVGQVASAPSESLLNGRDTPSVDLRTFALERTTAWAGLEKRPAHAFVFGKG
jgi:hypothetical protein